MKAKNQLIVLTGDRPTGPLHLGHYVGSLANRLKLQSTHRQYIMIADAQALTDNFSEPKKVHDNVLEVMLDYLAIGLDPKKCTFFIQTQIPEIAELAQYFMNLVTVSRLQRNPTVKTEIAEKNFGNSLPAGFLAYPISQAADILCVKAQIVPVGEDQLPMIEQTNEIVRTFNRYYGRVFAEVKAQLSAVGRLPGADGKSKMSKSLGNAIYLSSSRKEIEQVVMSMYTDSKHLKVSDPGRVEGNVVFTYLQAFDSDKAEVKKLAAQYSKGGLGDVVLKRRLIDVLDKFLQPIRERRQKLAKEPKKVMKILEQGTAVTRKVVLQTMKEVKTAMKINYF